MTRVVSAGDWPGGCSDWPIGRKQREILESDEASRLQPDVLGSPFPGRQIGSGNRAKSGMHTGQKEVQPALGKQALLRRCSGLP
jgi:hypothetical protein